MSNLPPLTPPDSSPVDPAMTDPSLREPVTDATTSNVTVGPVSLSRFNWRVAIGLFVGGALWIGPGRRCSYTRIQIYRLSVSA